MHQGFNATRLDAAKAKIQLQIQQCVAPEKLRQIEDTTKKEDTQSKQKKEPNQGRIPIMGMRPPSG